MKFISQGLIEQAAESLDDPGQSYEQLAEEMGKQQPVLLSYFFTDNFKAFTRSENEYVLYLLLVIWKAIRLSGEEIPPVIEQQVGEAEEYNWEVLQGVKAKSFHERLNIFFEGYPQEDLLAFVEDALAEEEEEDNNPIVTREGREAIFISLKSAIDCLTGWKPAPEKTNKG